MKKLFCVIFGLTFLFILSRILYAEVNFVLAQKRFLSANYEKASEYIDRSIHLNPYEPTYFRQRAKINLIQNKKDAALLDMQKSINLDPKNLTSTRNLLPLYYLLAKNENGIDENFLPTTLEFFKKMKDAYPNDLGVLVDIAGYEIKLGQKDMCNKTISQIKTLRADVLTWHPSLINFNVCF